VQNILAASHSDELYVVYSVYEKVEPLFSTRCNRYILRLCYDVRVRLSVHLSVTEVHWRIIANLGFKFRSQFTTREEIIAGKSGGIILHYASHC